MKIEWKMSIGFPTAVKMGEVEIDDNQLDEMTETSLQVYIDELVWDAAIQHVNTSWKIVKGE